METYVLLGIGIALVAFGVLVLVKWPERAGGAFRVFGVEINSTGAGLPLIVLGVATMVIAATVVKDTSPPQAPSAGQRLPTTASPSSSIAAPRPDPVPAREVVFVGATANRVAIVINIKGDKANGYLCDGNKIEAWLEGVVTGDQIDLRGTNAATLLTGALNLGSVSFVRGTVTTNTGELDYYARLAQSPAGLYEAREIVNGVELRIGWIVLPGRTQVGVQNVNGQRRPAPRLDPYQLKADGLEIPVKRVVADDDVVPGK